jgi:16S rRNA (cytosine1402-N4)-methyltransferase
MSHVPVLLNEVVGILDPQKGEFFIDGTFGEGGHATEILRRITPGGTFLGVDWDPEILERNADLPNRWPQNTVILENGNYADTFRMLKDHYLRKADGMIVDLGFSSWHIDESGRGFSFAKDEPLDMRYNPERNDRTAYEVVNSLPETELADVIYQYGEERNSRRIAKRIVDERRKKKIETAHELSEIVNSAFHFKGGKLSPATKTFQAIRIYVNGEFENIQKLLGSLPEILKPGGRLGIITFHSLEDKLVKDAFKLLHQKGQVDFLNKKVIKPGREEIIKNPKSRSAKLRAIHLKN